MMKDKRINLVFLYYFGILFFELIFRLTNFGLKIDIGVFYIVLFTISISLFIKLLVSLFKERVNKILNFIVFGFITAFFIAQFIYYKLYESIFSLYSFTATDQAVDSFGQVITKMGDNWYAMIAFLLPFAFMIIFRKKINFKPLKAKQRMISAILMVLLAILSVLSLNLDKKDMYSAKKLYYDVHSPALSITKIGLITTFEVDVYRAIFGFEEKIISIPTSPAVEIKEEKKEEYNLLEIDFDTLIENESDSTLKNMHQYFKDAKVTKKNEYSGMYKGKNLIFVTAEGFNTIAVDEKLTPTLYKMSTNSFTFDNFYTPLFLSTIDGEYQALMGLVPKSGAWSLSLARNISTPYTYGNAFIKEGYSTKAYHDGTYTYYKRNLSYPTLGFESYTACNSGLEKEMNCKKWPQSDVEMMNITVDDYVNNSPFMTYYLTVSGHLNYTFAGNNMASKNRSLVNDLPYSLEAKAYLATQIEFDRAMEVLLQKLEEAGQLENTVIVVVADHYPYGLSLDQINELSTYERDKNFEVHHSTLMIYNVGTEKVNITKPVGSIDILPTLLNLFGIKYDSRLIIGKDIFSGSEGLVMFQNRSWITEKGRYSTLDKKFTPSDGVEISEDYVNNINNEVSLKFSMSRGILDNDYYSKVLGE